MMLPVVFLALGLLAQVQQASAECANACNGHGKCTSYDMCICNRNWQAADCSERVCMFGLAHVDTPKVKSSAFHDYTLLSYRYY
jgi:hypothetical protein